jgi:hypothetical protein
MKDAPPASETESYKCGDGDKSFYEPLDSTDYNQHVLQNHYRYNNLVVT